MPALLFVVTFVELNLTALKEANSQSTFFSIVLCTNTAAVTSGENHLVVVK